MRLLVAAAAVLAAFVGSAQAQDYPSKPVTFVVPFSPGGSNDIVGRQLSKQLSEMWGQPVVVENRPGAGATVGSAHVAAQPPDGYTIMIASVTFTMNPAVQKSLPFDPESDFTRVAMIGQVPLVIGARPDIPAESPQEFFDYLKANPGSLNYGATGVGSIQHFAGELLNQAVGSSVQVVQYPGGGPAMTDVMGSHIEYSIGSMTQMLPQIRAGNIKPIAVTSSERSEAAPDVPTLQEAGLTDYEVLQWWGILAPAGVPEDILTKLNADINEVLNSQEMTDFLASEGGTPRPMEQPEFAAFMQSNFDRWKRVAEAANITAE
jgi:tripartite-type tricarboxylate transporter receptor subunit TctC